MVLFILLFNAISIFNIIYNIIILYIILIVLKQIDSVIHMYISFHILFHYGLSQDFEFSAIGSSTDSEA